MTTINDIYNNQKKIITISGNTNIKKLVKFNDKINKFKQNDFEYIKETNNKSTTTDDDDDDDDDDEDEDNETVVKYNFIKKLIEETKDLKNNINNENHRLNLNNNIDSYNLHYIIDMIVTSLENCLKKYDNINFSDVIKHEDDYYYSFEQNGGKKYTIKRANKKRRFTHKRHKRHK
jgi:hypothetical protein